MERDELIERLKVALAFDAQKGTDAQWSELLAQAHNALAFLSRLHPSWDGKGVVNADTSPPAKAETPVEKLTRFYASTTYPEGSSRMSPSYKDG